MAKELSILKRMLSPTQFLILTLRENGKVAGKGREGRRASGDGPGGGGKEGKEGDKDLVSDLTKVYLRDVTVSSLRSAQ